MVLSTPAVFFSFHANEIQALHLSGEMSQVDHDKRASQQRSRLNRPSERR
jgi:hypothetical protein